MLNQKSKSLIACTALMCSIFTVFSGCEKKVGAPAPTSTPATAPTASVQQTTPVETVPPTHQLAHTEAEGNLSSWELSPKVWSSSNGASITFSAVPRTYDPNTAVYFVVHLDSQKVEDVPCKWDGSVYTASVDLEAADGYEYECVVFQGQGEGESLMLSDAYDSLVYLKTSLAAYCNLYVSDFKTENGLFTVTAGFAHVQLPQLSVSGTTIGFSKAELVFQLNGNDIETQPVDLPVGEGVGSHEASLSAISFKMPQMEDDYQLDLNLNVTLTNGETLTANGGSWFFSNGELRMSAG